jgi:hypothetical protein
MDHAQMRPGHPYFVEHHGIVWFVGFVPDKDIPTGVTKRTHERACVFRWHGTMNAVCADDKQFYRWSSAVLREATADDVAVAHRMNHQLKLDCNSPGCWCEPLRQQAFDEFLRKGLDDDWLDRRGG